MQEGRLWGWGVDAFGVCSTIHCLLFGEYMQVEKTISPEGMCLPVSVYMILTMSECDLQVTF